MKRMITILLLASCSNSEETLRKAMVHAEKYALAGSAAELDWHGAEKVCKEFGAAAGYNDLYKVASELSANGTRIELYCSMKQEGHERRIELATAALYVLSRKTVECEHAKKTSGSNEKKFPQL